MMFVQPPRSYYPPHAEVNCTTSAWAPTLDLIFAGLEAVRTGFALSASDSAYRGQALSRPADISFGLSLTTAFAISAGYGFSAVSRCNELQDGDDPRARRHVPSSRSPRFSAVVATPPNPAPAPVLPAPATAQPTSLAPTAPGVPAPPAPPATPAVPQAIDPE